MKKSIFEEEKGFTLLELIVAMAIIGVLIGMSIAGIRLAQQISRDTQRKNLVSKDIAMLINSYNDKYSNLPSHIKTNCNSCQSSERCIYATDNASNMDFICSKITLNLNFSNDQINQCSNFNGVSTNAQQAEICYSASGTSYKLKVRLERSDTPYDASTSL